mgnify:CR=1 FL=1
MDNTTKIFILLVVLLIIYYLNRKVTEHFMTAEKELESYYNGSTMDVDNYLVDKMECHPDCCGDQWPVPFDGLSPTEIDEVLSNKNPTEYVRTNYTCATGPNGQGCPCIRKDPYRFLVNRGNNSHSLKENEIEPTFIIDRYENRSNYSTYTPDYNTDKSVFINKPILNDLELRRPEVNIDNVSPIQA